MPHKSLKKNGEDDRFADALQTVLGLAEESAGSLAEYAKGRPKDDPEQETLQGANRAIRIVRKALPQLLATTQAGEQQALAKHRLATLKAIQAMVEDGNVVELRPVGFHQILQQGLAAPPKKQNKKVTE
jgi:hypothetical protein